MLSLTGRLSILVCTGVSCGVPRSQPWVVLLGSSFNFGDKVMYMCRQGLTPATEPVLICGKDGKWDKTPRCLGNGDVCVCVCACACVRVFTLLCCLHTHTHTHTHAHKHINTHLLVCACVCTRASVRACMRGSEEGLQSGRIADSSRRASGCCYRLLLETFGRVSDSNI